MEPKTIGSETMMMAKSNIGNSGGNIASYGDSEMLKQLSKIAELEEKCRAFEDDVRYLEKSAERVSTVEGKVDQILESQQRVERGMNDIKDAMYKPDTGVFARIEKVSSRHELRLADVEKAVSALRKIQWIIIGAIVAAVTSGVIATITSKLAG